MSESSIGDLSKIVSLIMENPKLIEEISNLAKGESEAQKSEEARQGEVQTAQSAPVSSTGIVSHRDPSSRTKLLGALKPYVSEGRASAIDSMLSIAEVLEMMKAR